MNRIVAALLVASGGVALLLALFMPGGFFGDQPPAAPPAPQDRPASESQSPAPPGGDLRPASPPAAPALPTAASLPATSETPSAAPEAAPSLPPAFSSDNHQATPAVETPTVSAQPTPAELPLTFEKGVAPPADAGTTASPSTATPGQSIANREVSAPQPGGEVGDLAVAEPRLPGMGLLTDTGETEANRVLDPNAAMVRPNARAKKTVSPPVSRQPRRPETDKAGALPYSILLETYDNAENARKGLAFYQGRGLQAFTVRVDLGGDGIKHRLFAGSFATAEEARAMIASHRLSGKMVKRTPFTAMVGVFDQAAAMDEAKRKAAAAGLAAYSIGAAGGPAHLFVGAFYTQEGAERQCRDLQAAGLPCTATLRAASSR